MTLEGAGLTPEQLADLDDYQERPDRAAGEWLRTYGARWVERNPGTLREMDESFRQRYGLTKTWVVRDALRSVPRATSWLEVGCSSGVHMALLSALGFRAVLGTDISREALRRAPVGRVAQADARWLPFGTEAVDGVTTAGTLMHLGPPERLRNSLRELARVAARWLLLVELSAPQPAVVSFGDLLPPIWLYPWHVSTPEVLGEPWRCVYAREYDLGTDWLGLRAPMSVLLLERSP